jgi:4-diphosphocytidyl-2-C-methyl-D-erythritol kinase
MKTRLTLKSYAKINWTLDVLYRRDDGYHELRTIYQTISIHDRLHLGETGGAIEISSDDERVPLDETNLAYKAAALLRQEARLTKGAHIHIEKRIPVAAGLGGGSSNAAATLIGLARLWQIEADQSMLTRLAMKLGSDVPFFLVGGTALGIGRGEEVYPIEEAICEDLLLVNPGFAVHTADAYARLSRLTRFDADRIMPFTLFAAKAICELPLAASNDLEDVVAAAHPEIAEVKRRLLALGARRALMSGSGATLFAVFDNSELIERALKDARAAGWWAALASTIDRKRYWNTILD